MNSPLPHGGILVMSATVGPTAYGLNNENSDIDKLGTYVASNDHVFGLSGPDVVTNSSVTTSPDVTHHEIGKLLSLGLKCNPTILELFYAKQDIDMPGTTKLIKHRRQLLHRNGVLNAYGGYATQQAERIMRKHKGAKIRYAEDATAEMIREREVQRKVSIAKHARHCYRLILQGKQLLSNGEMHLNVHSKRDEIFGIGDLAVAEPERFYELFEQRRAEMDSINSVLPEQPDRDKTNDLLVDLRRTYG